MYEEQEYENHEEIHEHEDSGFMSYEELLEARKKLHCKFALQET